MKHRILLGTLEILQLDNYYTITYVYDYYIEERDVKKIKYCVLQVKDKRRTVELV